jgi:hypothetical protein
MQALEAIQAVEAVESFKALNKARLRIPAHLKNTHPYSIFASWTYYERTHHDPTGETCLYCEMFDGQTFLGSDLRTLFPDHYFDGDDIYPDVHKTLWGKEGTCACLLIREPDTIGENFLMWDGSINTDWTQQPNETEE